MDRLVITERDIIRTSREACRLDGTSQCAALCLSESVHSQRSGKCVHAVAVWSAKVEFYLRQAAHLFDEAALTDVAKAIAGPWGAEPEANPIYPLDERRGVRYRDMSATEEATRFAEAQAATREVLIRLAAKAANRQQAAGYLIPGSPPQPRKRVRERLPRAI